MAALKYRSIIVSVTAALGCGGAQGPAGPDESGQRSSPDAPQILEFRTDTEPLTPGGLVTFTAVVSDPQGVEDILGGTLHDDSDHQYGNFQQISAGTFEFATTWDAVNAINGITFTELPASRTFVARFIDASNEWAIRYLPLGLDCQGVEACGGECKDLSSDEDNCGACGERCPADIPCRQGVCECPEARVRCGNECANLDSDDFHCGDCDVVCPSQSSCTDSECMCDGSLTMCDGSCVNTDIDAINCGTCGRDCIHDYCSSGICMANLDSDTPVTCDSVCQAEGMICWFARAYYSSGACALYTDVSCNTVPDGQITMPCLSWFSMLSCSCYEP